ncbi:MAG: Usg family protein [bacterium]|nr:Usg family protein [bacterium]
MDIDKEFDLQLQGYQLTTAEILYHMPDHPTLLQAYLWQELDIVPNFPELQKFLDFWEGHLDGKLHSVKVASKDIISPSKFSYVQSSLTLH